MLHVLYMHDIVYVLNIHPTICNTSIHTNVCVYTYNEKVRREGHVPKILALLLPFLPPRCLILSQAYGIPQDYLLFPWERQLPPQMPRWLVAVVVQCNWHRP